MAVTLRPNTLNHYRRDMEHHVKPRLGAKPLTQLTASDLRKFYHALKQNSRAKPRPGQDRGLSGTSVCNIHTTLHHALKTAREHGLIPVNPADKVEPPKVIHPPMKVLNEEQLDIFLKPIKADEIWYDFFYTELTTGLRRDMDYLAPAQYSAAPQIPEAVRPYRMDLPRLAQPGAAYKSEQRLPAAEEAPDGGRAAQYQISRSETPKCQAQDTKFFNSRRKYPGQSWVLIVQDIQ